MEKTLDGFELQPYDTCWVSCQCPHGRHRLSPNPRPAVYMDDVAEIYGWMFTLKKRLRVDCEPEIIAVWKNKPEL